METVRYIPLADVIKNNGAYGRKRYIIVKNKVFDITGFNHPGGPEVFSDNREDKLEGFLQVGHSKKAQDLLKSFYIGELQN